MPYQLILGQDVLMYPIGYKAFMTNFRRRFQDAIVILDNGAAEGRCLTPLELIEAAKIIQPTYVVLPDTLDDPFHTHILARQAIVEASQVFPQGIPWTWMYVIHGRDTGEIISTIHQVSTNFRGEIGAWAVPRCQVASLGTRFATLQLLGGKPIHLLGCSHNISDDLYCATNHMDVMGIDSANPIVMGINNRALDRWNIESNWKHLIRPEDYLTRDWGSSSHNTDKWRAANNVEVMHGVLTRTFQQVQDANAWI
jgi:hypothetical protein